MSWAHWDAVNNSGLNTCALIHDTQYTFLLEDHLRRHFRVEQLDG